ncbi:unnamed protein product [Heterobilharzia americana]|nr:unnamed protein product [Heterobilharzia americana]
MEQRIKNAVKRLDQLDQRLNDYKPLLDQNVLNAEFEIRANFKSLMELLSKRQSNLLIQLNNIYKEKSLLIESNKQTVESLKSILIKSCITSRNEIDSSVGEYIRRAELITLTTDLTPFIAFHAENRQLSEVVSTFGRLISRYSGHFADPNQPSVCLPRAFEEEEDNNNNNDNDNNNNNVRIGKSTHSSVFNCIKSLQCSCNNPTLKPWLSSIEHKCQQKSSLHSISDSMKESELFTPRTNLFWANKLSDSLLREKTSPQHNFGLSPSQSAVHVPCYRPDSTIVRTWLELRDRQQLSESMSYHQGGNGFSDALKCPGYLDKSTSESFDILTNSSQNMSSLKDWLFCDPAELIDMPGLSTSASRCTRDYNSSVNNRSWLTPEKDTPELITTKIELFPEHLIKSGPIELSRWLRQQSPPPVASMKSETSTESNAQLSVGQNQCDNESKNISTPVSKVNEIEKFNAPVEFDTQYCPLYGICQGGPGGPTCCGGCSLSKLTSINVSSQQKKPMNSQESSENLSVIEQSEKSNLSTLITSSLSETSKPIIESNTSLVDELIRIANSEMKQWIINASQCDSCVNSSCCRRLQERRRQQQPNSVHLKATTTVPNNGIDQNCLSQLKLDNDMQVDEENDEPVTLSSNRYNLVSPIDLSESNRTCFSPLKCTTCISVTPKSSTTDVAATTTISDSYEYWLIQCGIEEN